MVLHSVYIENYKGIRGPLAVEFDPQSPNLLEGPNGVGKSTLVQAIERCLVESHNTSGASAEEMRPRGTALAPAIAVEFSHGDDRYRIVKTFLDAPKATLERRRADGGYDTIANGKTADEHVRKMLHSQPTKARDKAGDRMGLFSVMCSPQGKQDLPALSGDALADIRGMLGAQVSGAAGAAFERLITKKYLSVWTPGGNPKKGKLTEAQQSLDSAREDRAQCVALMKQVAGLQSSAREQRAQSQHTQERMLVLQTEHDAIDAVAQEVLALRARRLPAASRVDAATARYNQLRAEIDRIIDSQNCKHSCEDQAPILEKAEAEAKAARDARVQQAAAARDAWEAASQASPQIQQIEQRIERAAAFLQLAGELEATGARLERAREAAKRRQDLEREIAAVNAPARSDWNIIQAAGHDLDQAAVHVEALALRFEIAAETEIAADVIAGEPTGRVHIAAGQTFAARGDGAVTVALPGLATFRVTGPSGDAAIWRVRQQAAASRLHELLAPFGISRWQDLEKQVRQRDQIEMDLIGASAEYAAALGTERFEDLEGRHSEVARRRQELLSVEPSWTDIRPDVVALRAEAAVLKQKADIAQNLARSGWQKAERLCVGAESLAAKAAEVRSANESTLAEAKRVLAQLEADGLALSDRNENLAARRRECESAEDEVRGIDKSLQQLPADAPERASLLRQQIEALGSAIQTAREAYQQCEAAARVILLQGPYTCLASAEERVRQLEHDTAMETRRLESIQRLKQVVDEAKVKALAGIAAPVEARAAVLLERISGRPLARVHLGDGMALESVQPEGSDDSGAVDQMSAGEQEQIYFATRLALAEVLAEKERQVVVLDDPLVNTDTERLARVLELIAEKSSRLQFVILTCHPGRYLELPNAVTKSMEELMAAAVPTEAKA
ncbi:MAG: AAA family ATPase [Candidatus Sulfopaludibacter sp.]|nr:AAA family ATPase [Candidatus Sulfopaludibacter sp.]